MVRNILLALALVGLLAGAASHAAAEPDVQRYLPSFETDNLDLEMWAGISYRDALLGVAAIGGGAMLVTWLTGSAISGMTAAAALGAAYIFYDPGPIGVLSPTDLQGFGDRGGSGSRAH